MHEHALAPLRCRINEVKDLIRHLILRVEEDLVLLINPVKGEISNADTFPHVTDGITGAIDHVRHFIGYDEFQVL